MSSASCVPPGNCTRYTSVSSAPSVHSLLCSWSWKKGIVAKRLLNTATHLLICFAVSCSLVQFLGNSYVTVICLMPSHAALPTNIWTLHDFWGLQLSLFSCLSLLSLSWWHATSWRRAQQFSVPCVMLVVCCYDLRIGIRIQRRNHTNHAKRILLILAHLWCGVL
jgi:hypothetical protein